MAFGDVIGVARIQITPDMSLFAKATSAFAAAGAAAGALIVAGITEAMEQANITSTLQAQLGTTGKVAADQGKIAGKLYASGVSGTFQEAADAIKATVQSGLAPPGTTNAQLQQIATKAQDVSKVFGQDLGGVTNSVSQLMRTGLAKNSTEAFDILTKGFQSGADKAGDFLDTINEYGTQFRKAGVTGQQAIGIINQGLQAGARDADIVADAIKEFSIRAVDGSKLTASGFEALGLNADDMAAKFAKGGKSANAVLDITLDRLRNVKDPVKQSQIAVSLFGTQAEDLGKALFAIDPSEATKKIGKFSGSTAEMGKTLRSGPSYEIQIFMRRIKQAFVDVLGNQVLPVIAKFATWVNTYIAPPLTELAVAFGSVLVPAFSALVDGVTEVVKALVGFGKAVASLGEWLIPISILVGGFTLAIAANAIAVGTTTAVFSIYAAVIRGWAAITRAATAVQVAFNVVMNANPIILIITAIVALGAAIVIAYRKSETFRNIVKGLWEAMKTGFLAVVNAAKFVFNWIKDNWPLLLAILGGPLGLAVLQIVKHWDAIKEGAQNAIDSVIDFFKKLPGRILGAISGLGRLLVKAGQEVVNGLWNGAKATGEFVIKWFVDRPLAILRAIGRVERTLFQKGVDFLTGLWKGAQQVALTVVRWLGQRPAAFRNALGNITSTLAQKGRDFLNGLWVGAKAIYERVRTWITQRPAAFRNAIGNIGSTLAQKGRDLLSGLWNGAKARYDDVRKWFNGRAGAVKDALGKLGDLLYQRGRDVISGLFTGLKDRWKDAIEWVRGLKDKVVSAIKSAFGIASPARAMIPLGVNIMAGLMKGLLGTRGVLKSAVRGIFGSVTDVFRSGGSLLGDLFGDLGGSIGLGASGGSGRFKTIVALALRELGQPIGLMSTVLRRMNQESGGNPNAVNKWDINWKNGTPSVGLMQVIGPTFRAYAGKYRNRGPFQYGVSTDPLANIYASMRYAIARYGSLSAAYNRAGGYDLGGIASRAGLMFKYTNKPERVLSPRQTELFERLVTGRSGGAASAGDVLVIEKVVVENHGVIGSRHEVENWLVESLTTLKRKGRL